MTTTTKRSSLAEVLLDIAADAAKLESTASKILAYIKGEGVDTVDEFNDLVSAAYARNNWSQRVGRPAAGSTEKSAPEAVRYYLSTIRRGFRLELPVLEFETITELRAAIRQEQARQAEEGRAAATADTPPELRDLQVTHGGALTGALWHDAVVLWEHLPDAKRRQFADKVQKLLEQFRKAAPDIPEADTPDRPGLAA